MTAQLPKHRCGFPRFCPSVGTASPRPGDVQNHEIPGVALDLRNNLLCILGFATGYALKLALQDLFQPPAQDGMIISNKNPNH